MLTEFGIHYILESCVLLILLLLYGCILIYLTSW